MDSYAPRALFAHPRLAVAALAALLLGYLDLWRGGTTAAAVLLVVGYCVLAPLSLVGARRRC